MNTYTVEITYRIDMRGKSHLAQMNVEAPDRWRAALVGIQGLHDTHGVTDLLTVNIYKDHSTVHEH